MKKAFLCLAIFAIGGLQTAFAQDDDHEVSIGVGWGTNSDISSSIVKDLFDVGEGEELGKAGYSPGISAEYFYKASNLIRVGGFLAYSQSSRDIFHSANKELGTTLGVMKYNYVSAMPAVKFQWVDTKSFGFYSKLAAGVTVINQKNSSTKEGKMIITSETGVAFNFQVSAIGLEAGSPQWRGFLELGFGEQGIGFLGLRHRF